MTLKQTGDGTTEKSLKIQPFLSNRADLLIATQSNIQS